MTSNIVHNNDFESEIYDSEYDTDNEDEIIDFLTSDGNMTNFANIVNIDIYKENLVDQNNNQLLVPLTLENIHLVSIHQILNMLMNYNQ